MHFATSYNSYMNSASATPNVDYIAMLPSMLIFPTGSTSGMMQCTNVTIFEDTNFEYDETITLILTTSETYVTLENDATVITITSDERNYICIV